MFSSLTFFIVVVGLLLIFFSFIPFVKITSKKMRLAAVRFNELINQKKYEEAAQMLHPKLLKVASCDSIGQYLSKVGLGLPLTFQGKIRAYNVGILNGTVATYCYFEDGSHTDFTMDFVRLKGRWVICNIDKEFRNL